MRFLFILFLKSLCYRSHGRAIKGIENTKDSGLGKHLPNNKWPHSNSHHHTDHNGESNFLLKRAQAHEQAQAQVQEHEQAQVQEHEQAQEQEQAQVQGHEQGQVQVQVREQELEQEQVRGTSLRL